MSKLINIFRFIILEVSDKSKKIDKLYHFIKNKEKEFYDDGDERWVDLRGILRQIEYFKENGSFKAHQSEIDEKIKSFLSDLDPYCENYGCYKKGEKTGVLAKDVDVYKAIGDKILFRGVSLVDWGRIKNNGYIDSDMRDAILPNEGINLGQRVGTAFHYLPANSAGVILAISPIDLDLYMLRDEYLRVFDIIPIENVVKVSDVFVKDKYGEVLSERDDQVVKIINELSDLGILY